MTFKEYVHELNKYMTLHPETKDMLVIFATDEEGNDYDTLYFGPTCGRYNHFKRQFKPTGKTILLKGNAVCIN